MISLKMPISTPPARDTPDLLPIWPEGKMPGVSTTEPEISQVCPTDGTLRIENVSQPTLEVFLAAKSSDDPAPAALVFPGGGYRFLSYDKEGTDVARWLNRAGVSAFVLKYRVPDNRAGALQDAQRALRLIRSRATDWNIDPTRLGLIGFSAGGHLAARLTTGFLRSSYDALDASDEASCRPDFALLIYPAYLDTSEGHLAPELELNAQVPPVLIAHSEDDTTYVRGSKIFAAALREYHLPHRFHLYRTGGHGYGLIGPPEAETSQWPEHALAWLRDTLRIKGI